MSFESQSYLPNNFHLFIFCTPYTVPLQSGYMYMWEWYTYMRESSNEGQPIKRVAPSVSLESQSFSSEYCSLVYFLYTIYGTSTVQGITELRHLCPLIAVFFPNNFHVVILSTPFSVPLRYRVYVPVGVVIPVCGSPQVRGSP